MLWERDVFFKKVVIAVKSCSYMQFQEYLPWFGPIAMAKAVTAISWFLFFVKNIFLIFNVKS